LAFVGTAFAVLLAFIVFIAFDSYNSAKGAAESEAIDTVDISRNLDLFADPSRRELKGELVCYGRAVANSEWPAMRHQGRSVLVDDAEKALRIGSRRLDTGTAAHQAAFQQILSELDTLAQARRTRLAEASPVVPGPIWLVLVLGALMIVGIVLLLADRAESAVVQGVLMASVAAMLAASLALVWFLDHPYRDQTGSIRPTEMNRSIGIVLQEQPGITPRCGLDGRPQRGGA
jgi:hypothetical protein